MRPHLARKNESGGARQDTAASNYNNLMMTTRPALEAD